MQWSFAWIPELKLLVKIMEGPATYEDVVRSMDDEVELGLGTTDLSKLIDMRNVELRMTPDEVRKLSDWYVQHDLVSVPSRIAIVTGDPRATALSLLYERAMSPLRSTHTFTTPRAALTWLGVDPEEVAKHWADATKD